MPVVDIRCKHRGCAHAERGNVYRMVGRCSNCHADDLLFLITDGHEAPHGSLNGAECPRCGCNTAYATRLATEEEVPVAFEAGGITEGPRMSDFQAPCVGENWRTPGCKCRPTNTLYWELSGRQ